MKRINQALACVGGTKKGGQREKSFLPSCPFQRLLHRLPKLPPCFIVFKPEQNVRQICVLPLTTGTQFLSSSSNYLRQLPQNGNLIVPTSCHCVSEDDKSSGYKGSCWYFRHHVCCICCIQQLDSNLFTLIFDISMFNTGLP